MTDHTSPTQVTTEGCESCGFPATADDLRPVRRVYVVPESWETPGSHRIDDEVERWCFPCRTMYPCEPLA